MRGSRDFLFLTLVLASVVKIALASSTGFAAKSMPSSVFGNQDSPKLNASKKTPEEIERSKEEERLKRETVDVAIPPPLPPTQTPNEEYFYPYRQALSVSVGLSRRMDSPTDDKSPTTVSVQYFFTTADRVRFETGANLFSDGTGAFHFDKKWVFDTGKLRPFAKAGLGLMVEPKDQLAAFLKHKMFMIEGGVGAEFLIYGSQSVRAEAQAGFGIDVRHVLASVGYVWAW